MAHSPRFKVTAVTGSTPGDNGHYDFPTGRKDLYPIPPQNKAECGLSPPAGHILPGPFYAPALKKVSLQVDPGHPLVHVAEKLILNGPGQRSHFLHRDMGTKNFHFIPHLYAG